MKNSDMVDAFKMAMEAGKARPLTTWEFIKGSYVHGKYVARHKYYVFIAACKLGIPITGLFHDWHRLLPVEWVPYVRKFRNGPQAGRDKSGHYDPLNTGIKGFDMAWHQHQKRAWHHWQSWCCPTENGIDRVFEIPMRYRKEMLADWRGAARAQGTNDVQAHYLANRHHMLFGLETGRWLDWQMGLMTEQDWEWGVTKNWVVVIPESKE